MLFSGFWLLTLSCSPDLSLETRASEQNSNIDVKVIIFIIPVLFVLMVVIEQGIKVKGSITRIKPLIDALYEFRGVLLGYSNKL